MRDFYDTLGVSRSATQIEVQRAYQKLALKFHPDRNAQDPFFTLHYNRVKEAYEVLSDEHKRFRHDKALQQQEADHMPMDLPPPIITSFFASKSASQRGDALTLSWEVLNASHVRINLLGEVSTNGTQTVRLTEVSTHEPYINIDLEANNEAHPVSVRQRCQLKNLDYDGSPVPETPPIEAIPVLEVEHLEEYEEEELELKAQNFASKSSPTPRSESRPRKRPEPSRNPINSWFAYGLIIVLFFLIVVMLYTLFLINPIF